MPRKACKDAPRHPPGVVRDDRRDLRLLEHDLGHPHLVRALRAPLAPQRRVVRHAPRHAPRAVHAAVPREQRRAQRRRVRERVLREGMR